MDRLVIAGLTNAALAALLAAVAVAATRAWRNPYFGRIAWLAVLLKLVTPPLLLIPVEAAWLQPSEEPRPAATALASEASLGNAIAFEPTTLSAEAHSDFEPHASHQPAHLTPLATTSTEPTVPSAQWQTSLASYFNLHWRDLLPAIGIVWLGGSLVLGAMTLVRVWRFERLVHSSPLAPTAIATRADSIASRLALHGTPRLCVVAGRLAPLAWNLGRQATVIIPAALVESLDEPALDAILAHEFTHIRRRDAWARWLELLAASLYWWCPVVWIAQQRVREAEEQCCDADVLRMFPALRRGYGRALLQTLDLLAGDQLIAPGASGWGTRRSLRRRFEQIATDLRPAPLRRRGRCACWGTIALLCLLAPTAVSSEPPPAEPTKTTEPQTAAAAIDEPPPSEEASKLCTITLEDGSTISGKLLSEDAERLIVVRNESSADPKPEPPAAPMAPPAPARLADVEESKTWELSFQEVLRIAIENHPKYRVLRDANGKITLSPRDEGGLSREETQASSEELVLDLAQRYNELYLAWEGLAIRRESQDASLELWRRVKARYDGGAEGGTEADEAQCRSHYFLCRGQAETAQSQLLKSENRLRFIMGLAPGDGRLIRPVTPPELKERSVDWSTIYQEAVAKRAEIQAQRKRVQEEQRQQQDAEIAEFERGLQFDMPLGARLAKAQAAHARLLANREEAVLKDVELSVSHQLGEAVRQVDLTYGMMLTSANRRQAALDSVAAVQAVYDAGRASLDLLLQAQQHQAEAACAYQQSLADYQQAIVRLEKAKGTLLGSQGIGVSP